MFLVGKTHFDDEDGLLYVTKVVDVGKKSPVGPVVTLVSRALIMKDGLVASRYDEIPVHDAADVFRMMTESVLDTRRQEVGVFWRGFLSTS